MKSIMLLCASFLCAACNSDSSEYSLTPSKLVGSWKVSSNELQYHSLGFDHRSDVSPSAGTLIFNADGSGTLQNDAFLYPPSQSDPSSVFAFSWRIQYNIVYAEFKNAEVAAYHFDMTLKGDRALVEINSPKSASEPRKLAHLEKQL